MSLFLEISLYKKVCNLIRNCFNIFLFNFKTYIKRFKKKKFKVDNEPDFIDTEDNDLQEVFHTNAKEVIHTKNNDHQEVLQTNAKEKEMLHKDELVMLPMKKKDIVQSSGIYKNRTTDTLHDKEKTNKGGRIKTVKFEVLN